jgi:N-acetylmuramoyl-L-alanine amidase
MTEELSLYSTFDDITAVTLTLYGEARGEDPAGRIAVANVIKNRLSAGRFGATLAEVCLKRKQFSCWNENDPNRDLLLATLPEYRGGRLGPVLRECRWIAHGLVNGQFADNTHGATHYLRTELIEQTSWARGQKVLAHIGAHAFLRVA